MLSCTLCFQVEWAAGSFPGHAAGSRFDYHPDLDFSDTQREKIVENAQNSIKVTWTNIFLTLKLDFECTWITSHGIRKPPKKF